STGSLTRATTDCCGVATQSKMNRTAMRAKCLRGVRTCQDKLLEGHVSRVGWRMRSTITVMNAKGGVGKSTLVLALAETLSTYHGKSILVTLKLLAMARALSPASSRLRPSDCCLPVSFGFLPNFTPPALATARPALARPTMR